MKKAEVKVKVDWVQSSENPQSLSSVTEYGQLVVTEVDNFILIQGLRLDKVGAKLESNLFFINKEGAKNLVSHINKILENE